MQMVKKRKDILRFIDSGSCSSVATAVNTQLNHCIYTTFLHAVSNFVDMNALLEKIGEIQEQCGFCQAHGPLNQLHTFARTQGHGPLPSLGQLLQVTQFPYKQRDSLVHISGRKFDLFWMEVGLSQGCSLSPILFTHF